MCMIHLDLDYYLEIWTFLLIFFKYKHLFRGENFHQFKKRNRENDFNILINNIHRTLHINSSIRRNLIESQIDLKV